MRSDKSGSRTILWLWVWVAAGAGVTTAIGMGFARFGLHHFVHESPHLVWTAAVAYAIFTAPLAVAAQIAKRWLGDRADALALMTMVAMAGFGVLLNVRRIHHAALALIALGVGVQIARLFRRHRQRAMSIVYRSTPIFVGLLVIGAMTVVGRRTLGERRALAALPPPDGSLPNVLLLVLDTVRSFSLSAYGFPQPTSPALERLAAEGVLFEQAYSSSSWTLPSHASMMTGTWPRQNGASWTVPLDGRFGTLAEALSRLGYRTGGFIANTHYTGAGSGVERGFSHYSDWVISLPMILRSVEMGRLLLDHERTLRLFRRYAYFDRRLTPSVTRSFLEWKNRDSGRPFFAFLNVFDAHAAYDPPAPFDSLFGARDRRLKADLVNDGQWPADEVARHQRAYEGSIAYQDSWLAEMFAEMARDGSLDRTIVIVTSDHGEEFFEHDLMGHGLSLYPATVRVPLLIRYPPKIGRLRIGDAVSNRTIPSTVWDLVGAAGPSPFPGRSLGGFWDTGGQGGHSIEPVLITIDHAPNLPHAYPVSDGPLISVVESGFQYIVDSKGRRELYPIASDPARRPNLAADSSYRPVLERLVFLADSMTKEP